MKSGKYEEAEPFPTDNHAMLKATRGESDRLAMRALQRLVDFYSERGDPEKPAG